MENLWISVEWPLAAWSVDLSAQPPDGDAFLRLVLDVVTAGEREAVFCVLAASRIDYRRKRDGPLVDSLARAYAASGQVDCFAFTGAAMAPNVPGSSTVAAHMAWWHGSKRRRDGWVTDPGRILRAKDPLHERIPRAFKRSYPPVRIKGRAAGFRVELHSDIWFPWIAGSAHPDHDYGRMFDNRPLAEFHTPRLNRFLETVQHGVQQLGGVWGLDEESCADYYRFSLGDAGIDMGSDPPGGRMADS